MVIQPDSCFDREEVVTKNPQLLINEITQAELKMFY